MTGQNPTILREDGWASYALLDSGHGRKLERYGTVIVDRPEPQALWSPTLPAARWGQAQAVFKNASEREDDEGGNWDFQVKNPPEIWDVPVEGATCRARFMAFRHMGLFPEQRPHWAWMKNVIAGRPLKILNLFAYTGAASLIAAASGAQVTHVDASKKAIQWAKDNQDASKLGDAPIRWICEDARKFVAREIRRGNTYDGILLDPPKYGRGADGEVWRFESDIAPLLRDCAALLSPDASFMILTAYALRLSSVALGHMLRDVAPKRGGIDHGELWLGDEGGARPLPTSLFARWAA
ncbi:MAG: class I SAM-dependent methyltransferase [Rhodospirillales bacterium]|nr:class I SAM-dependent methyltransferase [Alphaproteobacteria bacterium]MCB9986210.1 class I SAM-dependent methyltransferase [Rhodospirillales bacterium]USO07233.1 MAG: class I SAM-dependent methyltransferase [Rhodospirillales bacterium]